LQPQIRHQRRSLFLQTRKANHVQGDCITEG
jgi:hypothetical protein